jgi:hypothetical protein
MMNRRPRADHVSTVLVMTMFVLLTLFTGCSRIPADIGRSNEVVVVSTKIDSVLIVEHLQLYTFVPQKENLFKFTYVHDSLIKYYKNYHTLFLYGSLEDEFLDILLRNDAKATTREDTFALFKLNDLWTRDQTVIILVASEHDHIRRAFTKFKPVITPLLEENYYQKIKQTYYVKKMSKKLKKTLASYGFTMDFDKQWMIDSTFRNEGFVFIHTHFPDRSVFYYREPLQEPLTDSLVFKKRDELTAQFYRGDYILRDFTTIEPIEFKELQGIRMRGVWQNDSLVAGGPFISYFFTHKDTLIAIDGLLFNPGERKSDYFTALEVILNSFEPVRDQ